MLFGRVSPHICKPPSPGLHATARNAGGAFRLPVKTPSRQVLLVSVTAVLRPTADSVLAAAWLLGILFAFNIFDESRRLPGMLVALCWIGPYAALRVMARRRSYSAVKAVGRPLVFFAVFLVACLPGSVYSRDSSVALGYLAATAVGGATCVLVGLLLGPQLKRALTLYAVVGTAGILWIFANYYTGGRFGIFRNPNSVGLILLGLFTFSFLIKRRSLRVPVAFTALVLLALTESRSALLGSVACVSVMALRAWQRWKRMTRVAALAALSTAGMLVMANASQVYTVLSVLMKLDDPWRGIASTHGTTIQGRIQVWRETVQVWREHPWVGVGYRTHETHIISESSSHNGYLAILAETGVVGATALLVFLVFALRRLRAVARQGSRLAWVGLAVVVGHGVVGVFERYLLNLGNPTSVAVMLFLLMPWPERRLMVSPRRTQAPHRYALRGRVSWTISATPPMDARMSRVQKP